jgi:NAD(P)-dependent dehydrogenase (short-subunit alcohol dehydrogenase family)
LERWGRIDVLVNNAATVYVASFERADVNETVEILISVCSIRRSSTSPQASLRSRWASTSVTGAL